MKNNSSKEKERRINRLKLMDLYGRRCWYCGQEIDLGGVDESVPPKKYGQKGRVEYDGTRLEIDHVISRGKGGDDSFENLALACGNCNKAKWNQGILQFLRWLAHIRSARFNCFILSRLPKEIIDKLEGTEWDRLRKDFFK